MSAWIDKSPEINHLATAWVKANGQIKDVIKTRKADTGNFAYTYADLATVLAMARPILAENGLLVTQTAESHEIAVVVWTTVLHESGQYVCLQPTRLPTGKTPQQTGSALSYARRYALMACLSLASEDDDALSAVPEKGAGNPRGSGVQARRGENRRASEGDRSPAEGEFRTILSELSPQLRAEAKTMFKATFGCALSEMPVVEHQSALDWLKGWVPR